MTKREKLLEAQRLLSEVEAETPVTWGNSGFLSHIRVAQSQILDAVKDLREVVA